MDSEKKLVIPESGISECPEYKVKLKIGNIFVNEKILEEYSVKVYEIDPCFYEHYKKSKSWWKWTLIHIIQNWCLFFWISFSCRNWWKRSYWQIPYFWGEKTRSAGKENLVVNLFELIQVNVMMKIMKLVEYKHLLVSLKTDN